MSLVHWDKSVLSFHLKEIIEDHKAGDGTALLGLGAIFLGTVALPVAAKFGRPLLKAIIKSGLSLYEESKSNIDFVSQSKSKKTQPSTVDSLKSLSGANKDRGVVNDLKVVEELSTLK
jgi:hypothetical protein